MTTEWWKKVWGKEGSLGVSDRKTRKADTAALNEEGFRLIIGLYAPNSIRPYCCFYCSTTQSLTAFYLILGPPLTIIWCIRLFGRSLRHPGLGQYFDVFLFWICVGEQS